MALPRRSKRGGELRTQFLPMYVAGFYLRTAATWQEERKLRTSGLGWVI
jgi:hypothetical protein